MNFELGIRIELEKPAKQVFEVKIRVGRFTTNYTEIEMYGIDMII